MATLSEQLNDLIARVDAATDAWAAAGWPVDGPVYEAREAVFADLREWNRRTSGH